MTAASTLPTGEKIVDTVMFRGMLFAATHDGVFYLDGPEWKRLELTPPARPKVDIKRLQNVLNTAGMFR